MSKLYTGVEIAKELGLTVHVLRYWLTKWGIEETSRFGGVKVYDLGQFRKIKKMVDAARAVDAFSSQKCPGQGVGFIIKPHLEGMADNRKAMLEN